MSVFVACCVLLVACCVDYISCVSFGLCCCLLFVACHLPIRVRCASCSLFVVVRWFAILSFIVSR